ncbi:MAG TPA: ABC transporter substrate-binding protein, partial [Geminicoccaceae bacterium]|nr:ABC transporter substrate-binding protein [Geminicoccaceae bacterium]
MRKLRLLTSSAALGLTAFAWSGGAVQAADQLTVVSWGGAYGMSQIEAYHKPFSKENGVEILS